MGVGATLLEQSSSSSLSSSPVPCLGCAGSWRPCWDVPRREKGLGTQDREGVLRGSREGPRGLWRSCIGQRSQGPRRGHRGGAGLEQGAGQRLQQLAKQQPRHHEGSRWAFPGSPSLVQTASLGPRPTRPDGLGRETLSSPALKCRRGDGPGERPQVPSGPRPGPGLERVPVLAPGNASRPPRPLPDLPAPPPAGDTGLPGGVALGTRTPPPRIKARAREDPRLPRGTEEDTSSAGGVGAGGPARAGAPGPGGAGERSCAGCGVPGAGGRPWRRGRPVRGGDGGRWSRSAGRARPVRDARG